MKNLYNLLIITLLSTGLNGSNYKNKTDEYCKLKASEFNSERLYKHVYNSCIKESKNKKYKTSQINKEMDKVNKQRAHIAELKKQNTKKTVGTWFINWGFQYKMTIYFKGKRLFYETVYSDGSKGKKVLKYQKIHNGALKILDIDPYGAYYIITPNKDLQFWSTRGKFYTAKKIKKDIQVSDMLDNGKSLRVGKKIPYSKWYEYGYPETLGGTNNSIWIAYLPKINKTFKASKQDDIVTSIKSGRVPNL